MVYVDPKIINVLSALGNRSIPTIALTHCGTGKFGRINDVADWRISQLHNAGVSFKKLSSYPNHVFGTLHGTAMFKSGILFTGYIDKGQVLLQFLKTNNINPKRIIFIDDRLINLQSVEDALSGHNIKFNGFEYTAVSEQKILDLDQKIISKQFSILEEELKWTSDAELLN